MKNGSIVVKAKLLNSLVKGPSIDAEITFVPDGNGGFTASGRSDGYPSLEAYYHRRDGSVDTLIRAGEQTFMSLYPPLDRTIRPPR